MEMCGIAGVNFLAESVPESSNLHLKFQKKIFRVKPTYWTLTVGVGNPSRT